MTAAASISVIVPCFNAERYIASSLRSVLAQDWADLEVIVVDDGSRDRSAELVADTFPQVTLLRQPNRGVAAARNAGIARARGEWIAFLDADDLWLPGKLQAQWQLLAGDSSARMSYCAWQVWSSAEPAPTADALTRLIDAPDDAARWSGPTGWIYPQLLLDCEVWTSTVLARRSLFEQIGGFDTGLRIGEDYDLWLRASRVTPILRVARPLALYRLHPASITRSVPDSNHRAAVVARAIERWGYASPDGRSARRLDVDRALARSWCDFAGAQLEAGNSDRARHGALMSIRLHPGHAGGWKVFVKSILRSQAVAATPAAPR